jgi:hypothetical protein
VPVHERRRDHRLQHVVHRRRRALPGAAAEVGDVARAGKLRLQFVVHRGDDLDAVGEHRRDERQHRRMHLVVEHHPLEEVRSELDGQRVRAPRQRPHRRAAPERAAGDDVLAARVGLGADRDDFRRRVGICLRCGGIRFGEGLAHR